MSLLTNPIRLKIVELLGTTFISTNLVYISGCSIIHFIFGMLIMLFLIKKRHINRLSTLYLILFIFEIIEFLGYSYFLTDYILVETPIDVVWDIIIGMFGGWIVVVLDRKRFFNSMKIID